MAHQKYTKSIDDFLITIDLYTEDCEEAYEKIIAQVEIEHDSIQLHKESKQIENNISGIVERFGDIFKNSQDEKDLLEIVLTNAIEEAEEKLSEEILFTPTDVITEFEEEIYRGV